VYAIMSVSIGVSIVVAQHLIMQPTVHGSVLEAGDRLAKALPQGATSSHTPYLPDQWLVSGSFPQEAGLTPVQSPSTQSTSQKSVQRNGVDAHEPNRRVTLLYSYRPQPLYASSLPIHELIQQVQSQGQITTTTNYGVGSTTTRSQTTKPVFNYKPVDQPVLSTYDGLDIRIALLMILLYLSMLFLVTTHALRRRTPLVFQWVNTKCFIQILALGAIACVIIGSLHTVTRIFWSGVNESFRMQNSVLMPSTGGYKTDATKLLWMNELTLFMLIGATVMTLIPILALVNKKLFKMCEPLRTDHTYDVKSPKADAYAARLLKLISCNKYIKILIWPSYVLFTVFLWTAPWSMSMADMIF
jgi:hypothetical protein